MQEQDTRKEKYELDLGDGKSLSFDEIFNYETRYTESHSFMDSLIVNFKQLKLEEAGKPDNIETQDLMQEIRFEGDETRRIRDQLIEESALDQVYLNVGSTTKKEFLEELIRKSPDEKSIERVSMLNLEYALEPGAKKEHFKLTNSLKDMLGTNEEECHTEFINQKIQQLDPPKVKMVFEELAKLFLQKTDPEKMAEIMYGARKLTGLVSGMQDFLMTTKSEMASRKPNDDAKNIIESLAKDTKSSVMEHITRGAGYSIDERTKDDVHIYIIKISPDFAAQFIQTKKIKKAAEEGISILAREYHLLPGIEEKMLAKILGAYDILRKKINDSNERLYQKRIKIQENTDELENKIKNDVVFGIRNRLYESSKAKKGYEEKKKKGLFKLYHRIVLKGVEDRKKEAEKELQDWQDKLVRLKGTEAGIRESEKGNFYLDKEVYEQYKMLMEKLPATLLDKIGEPRDISTLAMAVVRVLYTQYPKVGMLLSAQAHKFKEDIEYHNSRFRRIVSYHESRKGLTLDGSKRPEVLKFHDTALGREPGENEKLIGPIDYLVARNGKDVMLICESYTGLPVRENEIPDTVFRTAEEPKREIKERKIGRKILYGLAATAMLLLAGNIAQGYLGAKKDLYKTSKDVTVITGVQKTISDMTQSAKSLKQEGVSLTEKIAENDKTIDMLASKVTDLNLGITDTSKEEVKKKIEGLLAEYNEDNKIVLQGLGTVKGIRPSVNQVLDAYTKNGNIQMLRDTRIYSGGLDSAMLYTEYVNLVEKADFSKAHKLNNEFGPIDIARKDKIRFATSYALNPSFWELVGANHNFTELDNYDSFRDWAEYSNDYKINFRKDKKK